MAQSKHGILKIKVGEVMEKFFPKTYAGLVYLKDGKTTAEDKIEEIDAKTAEKINMVDSPDHPGDRDYQWSGYNVQNAIGTTYSKARKNTEKITGMENGSVHVGYADTTDGLHLKVYGRGTDINNVREKNTIVFIEK